MYYANQRIIIATLLELLTSVYEISAGAMRVLGAYNNLSYFMDINRNNNGYSLSYNKAEGCFEKSINVSLPLLIINSLV